ncbi:DUF1294 domain-containing protein [Alkalinema pantanalense CENA528]|uniref:DUF1294 domain-containing protein n=1 Tax=Alkalinema pantanalense TaxID=1620705 RepID=UPI003D6F3FC7
MSSQKRQGKLVQWTADRGFGFVKDEQNGQKIFIHITAFQSLKIPPQVGDLLTFHIGTDRKGRLKAENAHFQVNRSFLQRALVTAYRCPQLWTTMLPLGLLSSIPFLGSGYFWRLTNCGIPFALYAVMSLLTFWAYQNDKRRAKRNQWRWPEQVLHCLEFFGGWPGGLMAQQILRHKTLKTTYQISFWIICSLHFIGWFVWFVVQSRS